MTIDPARALALANSIFVDRFPGADYAFVAGPMINGTQYTGSRAMMVVVYRALPAAYRESVVAGGIPVDVFVHDPSTLSWLIEQEAGRGYHTMLVTVVHAQMIGRRIPVGRLFQSKLAERLVAGPPPMTLQQFDDLRFEVTEAIYAIKGPLQPEQFLGVGASLYPKLAELSLRTRGYWTGHGAWQRLLLDEVEQGLGARFDQAFSQFIGERKSEQLLALAHEELARIGGALVEGYRRDGLPSQRQDARTPLATMREQG